MHTEVSTDPLPIFLLDGCVLLVLRGLFLFIFNINPSSDT